MTSTLKRKQSGSLQPELHWMKPSSERPNELCLEACEANVRAGRRSTAILLEGPGSSSVQKGDEDETENKTQLVVWEVSGEQRPIWVDRFDVRLLLTSLPPSCDPRNESIIGPPSPTGWSDLPSDSEDTYFLSAEETSDLRATKRRRALDDARFERIAAMDATEIDREDERHNEASLYGENDEDESPDEDQLALMRRTAQHLHASPDRSKLMARILINHGADPRFAFLRGKWQREWNEVQHAISEEETRKKEETARQNQSNVLIGLTGYGESDDDGSDDERQTSLEKEQAHPIADNTFDEDVKKAARRERARLWTAQRRQALADSSKE